MRLSTEVAGPVEAAANEIVFLIGRPPMGEYLGYVSETVEGKQIDMRELADRWRSANDHVRALEKIEGGYANAAKAEPVPAEGSELAARIVADPTVRQTFGIVPFQIGMVELDRLIVYQKHIDLEHVRAIQSRMSPEPTLEELFAICMPLDEREDPDIAGGLVGRSANQSLYAFSSPSTDLRVLEDVVVDASTVQGLTTRNGVPRKLIVVAVGYSANFLCALRVNERLVLNNASHRAFALRDAGVTHVPCLIQNVSRREELEVIGVPELNQRFDTYFIEPRPPLLKDYFDDKLRMQLHATAKARQIRVVVQNEALDAPGA
jgi:hypothetical protein